MPWTTSSAVEQRREFLSLAALPHTVFTELCTQFGISRKTGYKWLRRVAEEGRGAIGDRPRHPRVRGTDTQEHWREKALALRRQHAAWGAKKIRALLQKAAGASEEVPSVRTLERWCKQAGLLKARRRTRRGPALPHPGLTLPGRVHEVWTVDFKGWYRTGDGQRQDPLTVRDLHTRYLLAVCLLPQP